MGVWTALVAAGALSRSGAGYADEAGAFPYLPVFLQALPPVGRAKLDTKGVTLSSDDGDVSLRIGGRLHYDFGAAGLDPKLSKPALATNADIRRAWFESYLTFRNGVSVAFQYDLSSATRPVDDAVIAYKADRFNIVFGNFKEPFSLDQLESNNTTLFTERSLLDTFAPQRDFGLGAGTHGERWTLFGGAFGGTPVATGITNYGIAGTARLTYAPILAAEEVLHFGVAGSYRALDRGGTALSFADKPEDFLFSTSLVSTGTIRNADAVGRFGLEGAYQRGPFRLQSEYALTTVSGAGAADRTFEAGYVEAGWVLNGKGREYRLVPTYASEYAVFQGVKVEDPQRVSHGGIGVFELGARFSAIDLRAGPVRGGAERDASLGLSWYPDDNIRLMADVVKARADPSAASVTGKPVDADLFIGRLQVSW